MEVPENGKWVGRKKCRSVAGNPASSMFIIRNMTYPYLIKRLVPFSLGFLSAVFVTSLFQAVGSIGQTAHVPEVADTSYSKTYSCKYKLRGYGSGHGTGYGVGTGTGVSSSETSGLRVFHKPRPEYTAEALENGTEGTVQLRVTFLPSGSIGSITPLNDLGDGLTEQAVAAAREIRFDPAKHNGAPVSTTKTIEYRFSIY
jgi:TonB family protein